ncbi:hybrid sensor histidine kinase/response regulator transcription factor [Alistipes sp. An66]|uniref:hybrid sensor histidine kinase/response regulator transcription factor n=1 Tax=Alistipes sp. An66 TaxID=1965650 RepID=UPI0013A60500|nr:ATP-binding protein [Alistipes sp. An66]
MSCLIDGEKVYAGTTDGYHVISSEDFSQSNETLRTRITGLNISNHRISVGERVGNDVLLTRNIDITDRLVLPHNRNSFTLEFSDFDFSLTEHRYAYRLKGLNDDWQITENGSNHATFINLPTGSYLFEVGSILSDGRIQEDPATLQIEVRPQWYAGPIAWVVYALLFVVLLAATVSAVRARRQLALEQAERDKALKMVKMKSDFLANLAHEFKTPLSIILGHVGKLISVEANSLYCQELVSMQRNAEKMHRLIDKMVTDNETDNGALFIPSATSIVELTRKVYDEFAPAMAEKGINTRFYCDNIRYIFMLDRVKIESVLSNLLSNAMKFTPAGGSILVSVTVGRETGDLIYADITVEDTGVGIRPEELPHIFNQYYRAASNQDRNSHGSGIGLYLVKSIVEMHKGTVSVDSTPGKGSRFTVRLSTMKADSFIMQDEDRDENVSLYSLSKVWNHERKPIILLVEDNRDIRDFITASLGDDYTFVCAENGKQGLELLAGNKIDLVITDIMMPVMDGLQMSRRIRRSMATAFLPIIILTGKNGPNVELESYEFADAFISKPFSLKYLNSRIIQLLIKHEQYLEKIRQEQMMTAQVEEIRNPDEVFLREITDLINAHIDDPDFSAARLCELSRYSSKQIYRKIKQLNGMGAVEFIREVRLRKAALYLKQNKLTVTEVMYMVGFTTPSYFSKCFKARFGVTPSEYAASEEK